MLNSPPPPRWVLRVSEMVPADDEIEVICCTRCFANFLDSLDVVIDSHVPKWIGITKHVHALWCGFYSCSEMGLSPTSLVWNYLPIHLLYSTKSTIDVGKYSIVPWILWVLVSPKECLASSCSLMVSQLYSTVSWQKVLMKSTWW